MAISRVTRSILEYVIDKRTVDETLKTSGKIKQSAVDIGDELRESSRDGIVGFDKLRAATSSITEKFGDLKDKIRDAIIGPPDPVTDLKQKIEAAEKAMANLNAETDEGAVRLESLSDEAARLQERLDKVRDFNIGLQGLSQSLQPLGLGGIGEKAQLGSDAIEFAKALPDIKQGLKDLPAGIKSVTSSIGIGGAGLVGGLAVLGFALGKLAEQTARSREIFNTQLNAQREYYNIVETLSEEEIRERIKEAEATAEAARRNIANLKIQTDAAEDGLENIEVSLLGVNVNLGIFGKGLAEISQASGYGGAASGFGSLNDQLQQSRVELTEAEAALNNYNRALDDEAVARNTARRNIEAQFELDRSLIEARSNSSDGIREEIAAFRALEPLMRDRIAALEEEGADVTALVKEYQREATRITRLETEVLTLVEAREREEEAIQAQIEAEEKLAEEREEQLMMQVEVQRLFNEELLQLEEDLATSRLEAQQQLLQDIQAAIDQAATDRQASLEEFTQTLEDIAKALDEGDLEAAKDLREQNFAAIQSFYRNEEKASIDHFRNLEDIRREAQESELELAAKRDFAGLFFNRRDTEKNLRDAERQRERDRQDAQREFDLEAADRQAEFDKAREERRINAEEERAEARQGFEERRAEIADNLKKELELITQNAEKQIRQLEDSSEKQIEIRRRQYEEEVRYAALSAQQRLEIERQMQSQLIAQYQRTLSTLSTPAGGFYQQGSNNNVSQTNNINVQNAAQIASTVTNTASQLLNFVLNGAGSLSGAFS